jgi:hypothetical protein
MQEKASKPTQGPKNTALWILLCFGVILPLLGLLVWRLLDLKRFQEAVRWPSTTGQVVSTSVNPSYDAQAEWYEYHFHVSYDYRAGGRLLSGRYSRVFLLGDTAREWARAYPPGSSVQVYYDPTDPRRHELWPAEGRQSALGKSIVLFGILVLFGQCILRDWLSERAQRRSSAKVA